MEAGVQSGCPEVRQAMIAQLVEHLICNQVVAGSNPARG